MKTSRVVLYGVLLACVAGLGAWRVVQVRADAVAEQARLKREADEAQYKAYSATIAMQRPSEDLAIGQYLPQRYTRPVSEWQASEKVFYEKLLASGKAEVLVLPFQVWGWAFDRATRSVMAAELAMAVARAGNVKVADPYLVARALGEGQRRLTKEDIYRLADATGAKRIIMGYAGHDRKGKMSVAVLTHEHVGERRNGAGWHTRISSHRLEGIPFGDETPSVEAYQSALPQLVKALGAAAPAATTLESRLDMDVLPPSPAGLIAADDNPARDAYVFLLYNLLTPQYLERTRERFAEKALLALSRLAPASPEYRVLRARTYMALGHRMAAIRVLGVPQTDEERGVLAALNGNLPEVRVMAEREKNPLKRLMQKLDENNIATAYAVVNQKQSLDQAAALKLPGNIWPFVVGRAFVDSDSWAQHDNASLKMLLDHELPVAGYRLEDMARGAMALGDRGKVQTMVDLSAFEHGRKYMSADAARWCCGIAVDRPGQLDYLELLQSMGHDNLIRRIPFLASIQGRPESAITYANSIDAVYRGHPYYAMERAKAEAKLAAKTGDPEKAGLLKASRENAFNAFYWEQGQSLVSNEAIEEFNSDGGQHFGYAGNLYHADIPFRPYYWTWADGGQREVIRANLGAALKNATWQIAAAYEMDENSGDEGRSERLLKSIEGRFLGSPYRNVMLSNEALRRGDSQAAQALYRENIRLTPDHWQSYEVLGKLLFADGDPAGAARVFNAYPGFRKGSSESRVAIANHAFEAGSYFYWSGHFDLAVPLYKIAASQHTGASSEITSDTRLKLLAGDIGAAMAGTLDRAQRYKESYARRDYLGMLHASGRSGEAWPVFTTLVEEGSPHIWETALVGHHKDALSEAQVVQWAKQKEFSEAGREGNAAAIYLLRFATTDRTPSVDLSVAIDGLDYARWKVEGVEGLVHERALAHMRAEAKRQRVKSPLAYFAEGYRALKLKDYSAARSIFDEAASFHDPANTSTYLSTSFYLPYYALAAAKSGDTAGIEKVMSRIKVTEQLFHYHLARAVLAGAGGKTAEALQSLDLARYRRPHTERRPLLTQYTYGEITEVVAELTGSPKAREMALFWARTNQKFEPWHSWAYAMEARLSNDPAGRQRALAMAHYLDPGSERISAFSKADLDSAVKAFGRANPFLAKPPEAVKKEVLKSAGRATQPLAARAALPPSAGPAG